jgi:hypothetical protein
MKSIGLYGDSFGTFSLPNGYDTGFNFHWSKILEKSLNWNITNYALSGSSVYESYNIFMQTHEKYDHNIFIVTIPGRYHKPLKFKNNDKEHRIVTLPHLETFKKDCKIKFTDSDQELLENLRGWYNVHDYLYDQKMCQLMIEKIKNLRSDTLFVTVIECYFDMPDINKPLFEIYQEQCALLGFEYNKPVYENTKLISGHFTPEINEVFADYIQTRILTGSWPKYKLPNDFKFKYTSKEYFNV